MNGGVTPPLRIGIDFGGTKIEAIALDAAGRTLFQRRVATPRDDYAGSIRAVVDLVAAAERESGARAPHVGVGIPGAISPATGFVKNANSTWLIGRPFDQDLAAALARPVAVQNDANCLALSEATDGAAAGASIVFAVILGTGVGGGVAIEGRVLQGADAIAGEWGHCPLPNPTDDERPGPLCYCGRRGCVETWCSGPALAADYARSLPTGRAVGAAEDVAAEDIAAEDIAAEDIAAEDIAAAAEAGDQAAQAALDRHVDRLARSLGSVVNLLDPEVVVLAGGLSNLAHLPERLADALPRHVFSDRVVVHIRRARHGDSSGVRGAAWLNPAPRGATQRSLSMTPEPSAAAAQSLEARRKRLRIRCWRRGTREMDLLLGGFADLALDHLSELELDAFDAFIAIDDDTLYRWLTGVEPAPAEHAGLVAEILAKRGV